MGERIPSLATATETLRKVYAALNRNDIAAMVEAFDPQMEWTDPDDSPMVGTYRGLEVVTAHMTKARATWAEGSCEPEQFIVAGDRVIVFVHVHVRLKDATEWLEGSLADVYTFRDGKVIQGRSFPDRQKALEWAGVQASDAP